MRADTGRKYRAYPRADQEQMLIDWDHDARALWNLALDHRLMVGRKHDGSWVWSTEQCVLLTEIRNDPDPSVNWIRDLPAQSGQQILRRLDRAFANMANPDHPAGPPVFKRRGDRIGIPFTGQAVRFRKLNRHWAEVRFPVLGWLRIRLSRALGGTIRNATIARDGLGWHVSLGVHSGAKPTAPNEGPGCGVDFGVSVSAWVSTEPAGRFMRPTLTPGEERRLTALEQRKERQLAYAEKRNGGARSNRLMRTIAAIGALRARQARRRLDFTHKLTTDLSKSHGFVGIEDLRVRNMAASASRSQAAGGKKNRNQKAGLNRGILDNAPGERRRQLAYKCALYGSDLRPVPPQGTSQTCPSCNKRDPRNRLRCGREFSCVHCGHTEHADRVASIEIEARARRMGDTDIKGTRSLRSEARGQATGARLRAAPAAAR
ncbi:transposase [Streptomyces cyaneochromogenes]|uniref:Transposase n=1 Tax=Streptomyces cyaneochromogenes TaxID=2496836 RepID=A0A3Q9EXP1_9ACTN|nr:RNA-guided endonuclease TnpB family protein [Streptomyces cyaneochromogenes]AZQ38113.1 transposase [Streptomyces cyaneochromogenes]